MIGSATNFHSKHGHCLVPHDWNQNLPLSRWVKRQRYQYQLLLQGKRSALTQDRLQKLQNLNFVWYAHAAVWEEKYQQLVQYHAKFGHCNVPSNSPAPYRQLSIWVRCQRRQYKLLLENKVTSRSATQRRNKGGSYQPRNSGMAGTGMTMERIQRLKSLGFEFHPRTNKHAQRQQQQQL